MESLFSTIVVSVITGIFSSLAASSLFLLILFRLRPNIEISPYIAVRRSENPVYRIKIINRTPRQIINVRAQLLITNMVAVPGGFITNNRHMTLKTSEVFRLGKYDKGDKNADYAFRFICPEDLDALWQEGQGNYIRFRVIATDSLTGFSKVFGREFHVKRTTFLEGSHSFGDSLEVG